MTSRLITAASVLALVSACSSQPGPMSLSPLQQGERALQAGDYSVAEQAFTGVLSANPNDPAAMLGLAQVYEATERSAQAVDLYQQVSSARSGAIRIVDGGLKQEGVTEVATRRLGALGHGMALQGKTSVAQGNVWPENPVYALDSNGMVYYADPEATQPITEPVFETPPATAQVRTIILEADRAYEVYEQSAPIAAAPAPVVQTEIQPTATAYGLDTGGTVYYADPGATQAINETVFETREAAERAMPAVARQTIPVAAPVTYAPAPVYQPAPVAYAPAPARQSIAPAPVVYAAPAPVAPVSNSSVIAPADAVTRSQPGYAVVDGNFVYISAEDIARGATTPSPVANVGSAESYGVPTPVASSSVPVGTPQGYSAPRGVDAVAPQPMIELNGIPNINLN